MCFIYVDNQNVQVFMEESKPFIKWLPGKIIMTKGLYHHDILFHFIIHTNYKLAGDFFIAKVSKPGNMENTNKVLGGFEFVSKNSVRPLCSYIRLSEDNNPFYRFDLPLSKDLMSFIQNDFKWLACYDLHKDFKKCIPQIISVLSDPEKKSLTCIAFQDTNDDYDKQQVIKRSTMLSSMHFNSLKDSYTHSSVVGNIKKRSAIIEKPSEYFLSLAVKKKFVGMSIGKQGANIQKARSMEGIISLELDDESSVFQIRGKSFAIFLFILYLKFLYWVGVSQEVCKAAADVLYFDEEQITYPIDFIQLFYDSKLVDEIITASGVLKVELFGQNKEDDQLKLLIIGKPDTFEKFKIILDFQKEDQDEINQLKYQLKMLRQQLYTMQTGASLSARTTNNNKATPKNFADAVKLGAKQ